MSPPTIELEAEVQKLLAVASEQPPIFEVGPEETRKLFDELQSGAAEKPAVDIEKREIPGGPGGKIAVKFFRPAQAAAILPPVIYLHGGGWVIGSEVTHDRMLRDLAIGAGAAVLFVDYSLSPEAKYPTALEECYAVTKWVAEHGAECGLDPASLTVAGDSAGGNLAAAVTLAAKERGVPRIRQQLLFYPVTDSTFDTGSYHQFAEGYFLRRDAMMWFWDQYVNEPSHREQITASPLRAALDQLRGLPPALVITAEADVLRDEGEAYANKLRAAGVRVTAARMQGTIHDFVMLNALASTAATRGALALATGWLRQGFGTRA